MADRRMLSKKITDNDNFLQLSASAQALYLHLNMSADDDGFCSQVAVCMFKAHASTQDLEALLDKRYIYQFENGVVVIKHWKLNNYIKNDRYKKTVYQEEYDLLKVKENGAYTLDNNAMYPKCIQDGSKMDTEWNHNGSEMDTQVRLELGKDRIELGKDRLGEVREGEHEGKDKTDYKKIVGMYNDTCVSFPRVANTNLSDNRKKAIKARLNKYSEADFQTVFTKAEASDFLKGANNRNWRATFDWLIKDTNMEKVLEGNYDNRQQTWTQQPTNRLAQELEESYRMMAEWAAQDEGGTDQ